ncbi:ATP-binding cassette subfamily G member 4-like [Panonychus citri]|uniref:ATP-binding cassette subfamily G member 4-like n=1 Tax=Panonychus citri TaxID=50023 RepID=UPI0023082961|nr:ATP-binding cassette subfamily G member 4-like [Panonychus citri]
MSEKTSVELNLLDKSPQITILPAKPVRTINQQSDGIINIDNDGNNSITDCTLSWNDLSYVIPRDSRLVHLFKRMATNRCDWRSKCILHPQSGQVSKGQMIAIIGRSGSGKSTLLQCLSGCKQKNRSGKVEVILNSQPSSSVNLSNGKKIENLPSSSSSISPSCSSSSSSKKPHMKICYIPQADHLIPTLTVYETLIYASKLRNLSQKCDNYHSIRVETIMADLNLTCSRSVMVKRISGGQRKRLSIGLELLGSPDIFLLDEPTSGLDSSNALQCVQLLKRLANNNNSSSINDQSPHIMSIMDNIIMTNGNNCGENKPQQSTGSSSSSSGLAIVASIHQPSAKILSQFDKIYLMSFDGRCIYFGPPSEMVTIFSTFDLNCPAYHNPADFAIEIASGDYGRDKVEALENWTNSNGPDPLPPTPPITVNESTCDNSMMALTVEEVVSDMLRQSKSNFAHFWILLNRTLLTTIRDPSLNGFRLIQHILIGLIVVLLYSNSIGTGSGCLNNIVNLNDLRNEERLTAQNLALIFFSLMFLTFAAMMPTVMVFPLEMSVFTKERKNGWYSCASFYFAKTFADLPYQLVYTFIYIAMVYFGTGQFFSWWRFAFFLSIGILISIIGQSIGLLFGALFAKYLQTAIFIAPISTLPLILISGFFVRLNTIPALLRPITYTSYLKYAFEALIITIYGYDRCTLSPSVDISVKESNGCTVVGQFYSYLRDDLNISFDALKDYIPLMAPDNRDVNVTIKLEQFTKALEKVDFNATQQIMETLNSTRSLVMTEYELEEANFVTNILALFGFIVIVRLITYIVLLQKSEKKID